MTKDSFSEYDGLVYNYPYTIDSVELSRDMVFAGDTIDVILTIRNGGDVAESAIAQTRLFDQIKRTEVSASPWGVTSVTHTHTAPTDTRRFNEEWSGSAEVFIEAMATELRTDRERGWGVTLVEAKDVIDVVGFSADGPLPKGGSGTALVEVRNSGYRAQSVRVEIGSGAGTATIPPRSIATVRTKVFTPNNTDTYGPLITVYDGKDVGGTVLAQYNASAEGDRIPLE